MAKMTEAALSLCRLVQELGFTPEEIRQLTEIIKTGHADSAETQQKYERLTDSVTARKNRKARRKNEQITE